MIDPTEKTYVAVREGLYFDGNGFKTDRDGATRLSSVQVRVLQYLYDKVEQETAPEIDLGEENIPLYEEGVCPACGGPVDSGVTDADPLALFMLCKNPGCETFGTRISAQYRIPFNRPWDDRD